MQEESKITRFGLIRHAQTIWNRQKRIQGQSDSPLTVEGERQAGRWGKMLKQFSWDRILASDTGRALKTAKLINDCLNLSLTTDPRLREQDWGQWTGKTVARLKTESGRKLDEQVNAGWSFCPPAGEDRRSVLARGLRALQAAAEEWPGDHILVVTHEGVVKSLIYHLCGRKFIESEPAMLKAYQLHWLVFQPGGLRIEEVNAFGLEP